MEQIGRLAEVLQLPADLLVVGLGRVPEAADVLRYYRDFTNTRGEG